MKIKKIMYVTDLYPPFLVGGAERVVYRDVEFLKKRKDFKISILTTNPLYNIRSFFPYKRELNGIIKYSYYPLNPYFSATNLDKVPNFIKGMTLIHGVENLHSRIMGKYISRDFNPNIVHSHFINHLSYGILKEFSAPIVHTFHSYLFECPKGCFLKTNGVICNKPLIPCIIRRYYLKKIFKSVSKIIVLNKFTQKRLVQLGYGSNKIIYLPNGIIIPDRKPAFSKKKNIILFIGNITKIKGVNVLVNAFNRIKNSGWKLLIVGKGALLQQLRSKNKNNSVKFLGYISNERLKTLLQEAKILVCPSIWREVNPLVNLEGMVNGLALLGSKVVGLLNVIKHGYNGFLFKVGDELDLKNKLELMLENKALLEKMCMNSWHKVKKDYNFIDRINKLNLLYDELI